MRARVPASSANLGPGFDTLAVALALYLDVELVEADELSVESTGFSLDVSPEDHLGVRVAESVLGHRRFALRVHSEIPPSRGLGSSAALAVAAAAAAGASDPLAVGARIDGHAENAAASVLGGLVVAGFDGDEVVARTLPLDAAWRFVLVVPDEELATSAARAVLPRDVPFGDAVSNLRHLGLLLAGLADHERFVASSMDDALHQPYRAALLEFATPLLEALREGGAAGAAWSGAGSSMVGLATDARADDVAAAASACVIERGLNASVRVLEADHVGLVTS